jgi:spore coat polysaccharide biosynthesis predicted glycosyltransferase SpsG
VSGPVPRVALCCDVGPAVVTDHVLRCLALADELVGRGVTVSFVCDAASMPWARAQIEARGLPAAPADGPDALLRELERLRADAVVLDAPGLGADGHAAVRDAGLPTLAVVGRDLPVADADVLVAPDVGAQEHGRPAPAGATVLAGPDYALMRNDVLAHRPVTTPAPRDVEVPRVVGVLDATGDSGDAETAEAAARLLADTGRPFEATFVTSSPQAREALADVRPAPRQRVSAVDPDLRVHQRVARADVVLATAGPLTCEWLCLGVAAGLVWADEDRVDLYRALMVRRTVVGLGSAAGLAEDPDAAADKASRLLGDPAERARLAQTGWRLVDGLGRARVADALLGLVAGA